MRHPGLQHKMRLSEIAEQLSCCNVEVVCQQQEIDRLQAKLRECNRKQEEAASKRDRLIEIQDELCSATAFTEFGLPGGMTKDIFYARTGIEIRS